MTADSDRSDNWLNLYRGASLFLLAMIVSILGYFGSATLIQISEMQTKMNDRLDTIAVQMVRLDVRGTNDRNDIVELKTAAHDTQVQISSVHDAVTRLEVLRGGK